MRCTWVWGPFKFNNKVGVENGGVLGRGSVEVWGGLHNTRVVVGGFLSVKGEEGGCEGELKIRGLTVCVYVQVIDYLPPQLDLGYASV